MAENINEQLIPNEEMFQKIYLNSINGLLTTDDHWCRN